MTWGLSRRSRDRLARRLTLGSTAAVFIGLAVWLLTHPGASESTAGVASLFVGLVSLGLSLLDFFRNQPAQTAPAALADDLALTVQDQWLDEALVRRLRDPRVLPLAWSATSREVVDPPAGGVLRIRLDGRLDGRFDEVVRQLADGYRKLPNRRLVVLGEPGAGKTVLGILLTLGLLAAREEGGPVPLLLTASSWDPVREPFDDWIVRALAVPYYNGREEIPRTLLRHGLLLPILDGLDEIPESARRSAVRGINRAIGGERPVVVTCRVAEYQDLIRGGSPVLRRAPVVEVLPIPPRDVITYLRDVDWPTGVADGWEAVFDHLRSEPDSPLAEALSTPLMVSSARLVYQRDGANPAELLDTAKFDSRYAVEEDLTSRLVDAAYSPGGPWDAGDARRWLTFLADYLHDHRERDLAWWRMSQRLLSPWFAPAVGFGVGLVLLMVSAATTVLLLRNRTDGLIISALIGAGFALLTTVFWSTATGRQPGRLSPAARGSWERLRRGFGAGIALPSVTVLPVLACIIVFLAIGRTDDSSVFGTIEVSCQILLTYVSLTTVIGLAMAAHNWLDAPPSRSARVGVRESVIQDRRSAVVGALTAGTIAGALGLLAWVGGGIAGSLVSGLLTHWSGWPGKPALSDIAHYRWNQTLGAFDDRPVLVVVVTGLLPGTVVGLLVLVTRAWPRFVVVRLVLAARGRLPWRLLAFLADARKRGLLRQAGGMYQFRHIRLQETLATYRQTADSTRASGRPLNRRLVLSAGATVSIAGIAAVAGARLPEDMSAVVFAEDAPMDSVAFHPSGNLVAASSGVAGTVHLWDTRDRRRPIHILHFPKDDHFSSSRLAFHPKGHFLAVASSAGLEIWDMRSIGTAKHPEPIWSQRSSFPSFAFSKQQDVLAFRTGLEMKLLNLETRKLDSVKNNPAEPNLPLSELAFSTSDEWLAVDRYDGVRVYELTHGGHRKLKGTPYTPGANPGAPATLAFNSDDSWLARADRLGRLQFWDTRTWQPLRSLNFGDSTTLAFNPAGSLLAIGDSGGTIRLVDINEGKVDRKLIGHTSSVGGLSFSPGGQWLASAGEDQTVRLWDLRSR